MNPKLFELPDVPGAYRWYYADVSAGEWTAVAIFMVGSLFSARYSAAIPRGARPREHCAVNFALYRRGARVAWVLSEYPEACPGERGLSIGRSKLERRPDGGLRLEIDDCTAPWGTPLRASMELTPGFGGADELALIPGQPHCWQPLILGGTARLSVPTLGIAVEGAGYHDTNHGASRLGDELPGWTWTRIHGPDETLIRYACQGAEDELEVRALRAGVTVRRRPAQLPLARRTGWGLRVPARLEAGPFALERPVLIESSPFYARAEARQGPLHALGESADFRTFHRPWIRWMARFRTREGAAA